jgi:hypothetical protein
MHCVQNSANLAQATQRVHVECRAQVVVFPFQALERDGLVWPVELGSEDLHQGQVVQRVLPADHRFPAARLKLSRTSRMCLARMWAIRRST